MKKDPTVILYKTEHHSKLITFLENCLPESGRILDIDRRHSFYKDIEHNFEIFLCMVMEDEIIGTVAVREINDTDCELKSLYLLEKFHGAGYGRKLLETAIGYAKERGYERMYLDSLSTSERALKLYRMAGFKDTEKYNDSMYSDVFMYLELKE